MKKKLYELWIDNPNILEELVQESQLDSDELAVVFVKHPMLQDIILRYKDAEELYNTVYKSQVENANPGDYEQNWHEYQAVHEEYVNALNAIKNYVFENPEYSDPQFVENLAYAPVEVQNWDDPYGALKEDKEVSAITDKDLIEADEQLDEFYAEYPEMDDRPDSQIPEGMSIDEYAETMGVTISNG